MTQFARTWRPQRFEEVVGQELVVSLLRNSLFRNSIFPVYLFAGQRGCGKTTLARIFAAALNCEQRVQFSTDPRAVSIPCYACSSCVAMREGSHTDFHEIDAASHTGVDHVRAILEATTLAPQMGQKKIYLIDEVHMLSRAACNALLKTLEEPLESVVFLLATTDPHKIPETVRSRCFHLFLSPHLHEHVCQQLTRICVQEGIAYDEAGIAALAAPSEGSLRDAINALERVVIAYGRVHEAEVRTLMGMVTLAEVLDIAEAVARKDASQVLALARRPSLLLAGVSQVCRMWYELLRALIACHYGICSRETAVYEPRMRALLEHFPLARIMESWQATYAMEAAMLKSGHPLALWELLLVRLCQESLMPQKSLIPREGELSARPRALARTSDPAPVPATEYTGEALWDKVLAHMDQAQPSASRPVTREAPARTSTSAGPSRQRAEQPSSSGQSSTQKVQHDELTKKMLALFPGTITKE